MRESQIESYLVERVKALGGECRKLKWIGRHGAPDRLVMLPDRPLRLGIDRGPIHQRLDKLEAEFQGRRTIWVELKAPGEKAKPHQVREHERMRRMGQRVEIVDSIERVDEVLA